MFKLINKIYKLYYYLESKIAFYPTIITLGGILFTFFMFYLESLNVSKWVIETIPQLEIKDPDTAKTLLSTIIGGLISLMVFSFSMVMVVLNQASSNFSPRLLPGLISNKNHQYVLGIYLSTIVYGILIFLSVESGDDKNQLPILSVLFAILFTVCCLALFIYFIHSISQAIQVNNIVKNIYVESSEKLKILLQNEKPSLPTLDFNKWQTYTSKSVGYFGGINERSLKKIIKEYKDLHLHITVYKGKFIQYNDEIFKANQALSQEQVKNIISCFKFSDGEFVTENYVLAYKQLTEIAVKAMSPGINDPGTAILCLDYLTVLLKLRMEWNDKADVENLNNHYLIKNIIPFKDILSIILIELRKYCAADLIIVLKLLQMLHYLNQQKAAEFSFKNTIKEEFSILKNEALNKVDNDADKQKIALISL
ncbi:DUF2254 domain-containing protein [Zhouia sp. PK063]|uniref:DUF2254 domain-containing protein n=1 Tax=Zhouia sp. PK063 TaxID=3373602 RepID=UPI0037937CB6